MHKLYSGRGLQNKEEGKEVWKKMKMTKVME